MRLTTADPYGVRKHQTLDDEGPPSASREQLHDSPREVEREQHHEELEVPWGLRLLLAFLGGQLAQIKVLRRDRLSRRRLDRAPTRRARAVLVHRCRRPVLGAVLAPRH